LTARILRSTDSKRSFDGDVAARNYVGISRRVE